MYSRALARVIPHLRKRLHKLLRQLRLHRDIQLRSQHHGVGNGLRAGMIVEEDVGALNFLVFEDGFQAYGIGLELFRFIQIIVPLVAMLVSPPLFELPAVQSQVEQPAWRNFEILTDRIFEFRLVDEGWSGVEFLKRWQHISPG